MLPWHKLGRKGLQPCTGHSFYIFCVECVVSVGRYSITEPTGLLDGYIIYCLFSQSYNLNA